MTSLVPYFLTKLVYLGVGDLRVCLGRVVAGDQGVAENGRVIIFGILCYLLECDTRPVTNRLLFQRYRIPLRLRDFLVSL